VDILSPRCTEGLVEPVLFDSGNRHFRDTYAGTAMVTCAAAPEVVYDLLANLRTHVVWGGQPGRNQHLIAIDCPMEPATVGTEFRSVGYTSHGNWHDCSVVTEAVRPEVFAFSTTGTMRSHEPFHGGWLHRYDIQAHSRGSLILYRCHWRLTRIIADGSRIRRSVFSRVVLPTIWETGLRRLAAMAEETLGR
jgi:hypothetical protein